MNTREMTPRALTAAALSGQIDRKDLDPADRLACIEAIRARLDEAEDATVAEMRRNGSTWANVGDLYGLTRQAAQMKFRDRVPGTLDKLDEFRGREVRA